MKYLDNFLDNWFLPLCLVVVGGWISLRQSFIFNEHKDMLKRLVELEKKEAVIDTKLTTMAEKQSDIQVTVNETLKILKDIQITQAVQGALHEQESARTL